MRRRVSLAIIGLLCLAPVVFAQNSAPAEKTGLPVGEKAPAFRLKDQDGKQRTLDDLATGVDYVAIVFYRSADW